MKTLFASALLALTFAVSNTFAADNHEKAKPKSTFQSAVYPIINSMKVSVNVQKETDSKINIRLINSEGRTLATKRLGEGHEITTIRFDLNQLEDGVYKVEITDGANTEVKTVKLQTSTPVVESLRLVSMN
ncbi:T9SS type A sorting domain-containing protein [Larkinella punicea]|uniref:T9SS C-terminal target domain-containing protein n=1 Tax=Larkinella punicea TaxID=2315727 RepID=A0A368JMB0_9BACT|nr:T9SS type A sorting domain-containing protein [Larkinella punicea]RCR68642.1 T9SS C-terminal target domain-containing protein [Larkinella punicea]